jgi:hypothetical protein
MNRIYAGQSALRITLKTFIDLEGSISAIFKSRNPAGSRGFVAAGVGDLATGVIFHECIEGEINMAGWWVFWAFITFGDGRSAAGETAKVYVWKEGFGYWRNGKRRKNGTKRISANSKLSSKNSPPMKLSGPMIYCCGIG